MKRAEPERPVAGNFYDKRGSRHPVERMLVRGFDAAFLSLVAGLDLARVLDIGCGEGDIIPLVKGLSPDCRYVAVDTEERLLAGARDKGADETCLVSPSGPLSLPFPDGEFTLVLMLEVLEHVPDPAGLLAEGRRLTSAHLVASVPWEPVWRILNVLRLKYLPRFGNTPGHANHWGRAGFKQLVAGRFNVEALRRPFPWSMILAHR